jgi:excisionase family DNA binding protein
VYKSKQRRQVPTHDALPVADEHKPVASPPVLDPILVTPEEVSWLLRLSRSKIYLMLKSGEIPSLKVGRACRIRLLDLEAWTERKLQDGRH